MTDDLEAVYPTREDVWNARSARTAFPIPLVEGARTAASFFSAAFYGRNDVVYLDEVGVPHIMLVDIKAEQLAAMAAIYPGVTETHAEDAFAVAERMRRENRGFDVVITDPWAEGAWPVVTQHFATFAALTRRCWVTGVMADDFAEAGVPVTLEGVQSWLDAQGHSEFVAAWLKLRNSANGAYWLGLCRRRSRRDRMLARLLRPAKLLGRTRAKEVSR